MYQSASDTNVARKNLNNMVYNIISSGSHGNCEIYLESVAIDMGVSFSAIKPYVKDLQLVLLSHEHL